MIHSLGSPTFGIVMAEFDYWRPKFDYVGVYGFDPGVLSLNEMNESGEIVISDPVGQGFMLEDHVFYLSDGSMLGDHNLSRYDEGSSKLSLHLLRKNIVLDDSFIMELDPCASEFDQVKVNYRMLKLVLRANFLGSITCLEIFSFDP